MSNNDTITNQCTHKLRHAIIKGEFAPGEKLKIERLKLYLNSGPTPIREALSRLINSGLIIDEANKGFRVKPLVEKEVIDIYNTFIAIEQLALQKSIQQGSLQWEAGVAGALHALAIIEKNSVSVDLEAWVDCNYQFHLALINGCDSPCLLQIRENLYQQFDRFCRLSFLANRERLQLNHQEHIDIAEAALARNDVQACTLIKKHLEYSKGIVLENLKELKFL